ncbi:MAG: glycosyltransferase family 2 protein [Dermatophilus congolensis]|nr:glycosyltransferase family 2 protein [Dermatophilus congolensis]
MSAVPAEFPRVHRRASVVIPAHNEARVIGRTLEALLASEDVELDIVVVANGCSDDTAAVAASYAGVRVIDLASPGKAGALNEGDALARWFPRIYLDGDIVLSPLALSAMIDALETDAARVASPAVDFDTEGASWPVRAFYDVFTQTPYATDSLTGLGVYGLSQAARERFDRFPQLTADDLFVQRLFEPEERVVADGRFRVSVPRDLRNLVRVRTRVAKGNTELARQRESEDDTRFESTSSSTLRRIGDLVRKQPRLAPSAGVYIGVSLVSRLRARTTRTRWERDLSTR